MIIGFDYWQVLSHFPHEINTIAQALEADGHEIHVISAIGKSRRGTIVGEVYKLAPWIAPQNVHEVVFENSRQSPELKLAKCLELGIDVFYDDRDDVCKLLNANSIMACRVTRKDNSTYDLGAERT